MRSFIFFMLILLGLSFSKIQAQNTDAQVTVTKVIDQSADKIWQLLRVMDDIDQYSSLVARVEWQGNKGEGGKRVCYSPDQKSHYTEGIISFDDANRTYTYQVLEGVPANEMVNSFKVIDLGYQKCMIVWTSNYDSFVENPNMTETQFTAFLHKSVQELIDNMVLATQKG
ncbi:MAG: SRPBCC family protein [Thermonemataceae bacterium]